MSSALFVSLGTRSVARLRNATIVPSPLIELLCDSALPDTPAVLTLTSVVVPVGDVADERVAQVVGVVGDEVGRVAAEADEAGRRR